MAIPHIIKQKGTIVNVSSVAGPCPFPGVTYYCMSKAGKTSTLLNHPLLFIALDQFTKCLALELARSGVRVNSVK
jgi:NAD(P)-dependent dehydrogenase (short-subunit alcohol dehydrogenase family)